MHSREEAGELASRRALQDSERLQSSVLAVLDEGVAVMDLKGRLVQANAAARSILGLDTARIDSDPGQWQSLARGGAKQSPPADIGSRVLTTGRGLWDIDVGLDRPDGRSILLSVNYLPLRGDMGTVSGLVLSFCDITDRESERRKLVEMRDFLQETLDTLPAHVAVLDERGRIITTNHAWTQFGRDNDAVAPAGQGDNYLAACDAAPDDRWAQQAALGLRELLAGGQTEFSLEYPCHSPHVNRWYVLRAAPYLGRGNPRIVVAHTDITKRRRVEEEVTTQAALLDEVDVAVVASDLDGRVTHWNRGAEHLYGWARAETVSRHVEELIVPTDRNNTSPTPAELRVLGRWEGEFEVYRKDGSSFPAYVRERLISSDDGSPVGTIAVSADVSERVTYQHALLAASNHLQAVTNSMGEGLYTTDTEGRLTYMNQAAERLLGWSLAEAQGRIMHHFAHRSRPDGSEYPIEECPILKTRRDGDTVRVDDEVFIHRDGRQIPVAYTASPLQTKDGVQGCVVVFEDISERRAREESMRHDVEKLSGIDRVQQALTEGRILLYAQPIIELRTGAVVQRELLLRVREADESVVGPGAYLPIAEQYGLIVDIDRWVIRRACEIAASGLPVQVNVSARSIGDPTILDHIERCMEQTGADPQLLVFEITETALVEDEAAGLSFAERLHTLGCELALDDFGTGYGSFTYLKRLPVDYLKIDVEFVRDLASSPASRHVVEAVVALARSFSLRTVAEGVEDRAALDLLRELGVDFAQGFYIGRPAPLE